MPAKIITLSQKDQDLLRAALLRAIEWQGIMETQMFVPDLSERIKDLKNRLLI